MAESEPKFEYGNIVWYLDSDTKEIHYGIDGEDNNQFISYNCIKNASVLGHPEHINHFDIWFTKNFQPSRIKGFIKLSKEYHETFNMQDEEIQKDFRNWMSSVFAGRISSDNKSLVCYSIKPPDQKMLAIVGGFFKQQNFVNDETDVFHDEAFIGKLGKLMEPRKILLASIVAQVEPTEPTPSVELSGPEASATPDIPIPKEDPEVLEWIKQFKAGDKEAGEKLYNKYERLIIKIWSERLSKTGIDKRSPEAEDALSEAMVAFLKTLKAFDPTRGIMFSSYLGKVLDGIVRNYFNFGRHKERTKEVSMPNNSERSEDEVNQGLDSFTTPEKPDNEQSIKSVQDAVEEVLTDDRDKFIFEEFFMKKRTLVDIGDEIGLTKERVRQILNNVVQQIRNKVDPNMLGEKVKLGMIFNEQESAPAATE